MDFCSSCSGSNLINRDTFLFCIDCNSFSETLQKTDSKSCYESEYTTDLCSICKSIDWINDDKNGAVICRNCGNIQNHIYISNKQDWSSYTDDQSQGINKSRISSYDKNNPKLTLGSTISSTDKKKCIFTIRGPDGPNGEKTFFKRNITKLNYIAACMESHNKEEQAYHRVIKQLNKYDINKRVINTSVYIWSFVYNTGVTYRGRCRLGILANCIYQACLILNYSRTKRSIKDLLDVTDKEFSKGTRILSVYYPKMIRIEDDNIIKPEAIFSCIISQFKEYCQEDRYTYRNYVPRCVEIYNLCKNRSLDANKVSMDTAKAGVIYYVFKEKKQFPIPKVSIIKKILKVTNPTGAYNRIIQQFKEDKAILVIQRFYRKSAGSRP